MDSSRQDYIEGKCDNKSLLKARGKVTKGHDGSGGRQKRE
jgi:hypothetical protein